MSRQVSDSNLSTRAARGKLKPRAKPYWRLIEHGRHIGYRRTPRGGTWVARLYLGSGKYAETRLGTADNIADADEVEVLAWGQAQQAAHEWFVRRQREEEGLHPDSKKKWTVADAVHEYLEWFKLHRKSYADTRQYAEAHILPVLGSIEISKLRSVQIEKWRDGIASSAPRRRSKPGAAQNYGPAPSDKESSRSRKVTANRVLTILKAALNKWAKRHKLTDRSAWTDAERFPGVDAARHRFLEHDEAVRLINSCDPVFRPLVRAALLTGARYGELAALKVDDFKNGKLFISTSKTGKPRWVSLTDEGRQFFIGLTTGREQSETLFLKNAKPWGKSHQNEFMKQACINAKLEPMGFHQLRHSYASMTVMSGLPLLILAGNLGHVDTRMVERHYGHLVQSFKDRMIEEHAPKFGIADEGNVIGLKLKN
jgi:integrase